MVGNRKNAENLPFLRSGFNRSVTKTITKVPVSSEISVMSKEKKVTFAGSSNRNLELEFDTYSAASVNNFVNKVTENQESHILLNGVIPGTVNRSDTTTITRMESGSSASTSEEVNMDSSTTEHAEKESPVTETKKISPGYEYYKQAGEYWTKFPKTDYTYSVCSELYKKEWAEGVIIKPNMSRRPLRSSSSSVTATPLSSRRNSDYVTTSTTTRYIENEETQTHVVGSYDQLPPGYASYRLATPRRWYERSDFDHYSRTERSFMYRWFWSIVTIITTCMTSVYTYAILNPWNYVRGTSSVSKASSSVYATPTYYRMSAVNKSWARLLLEKWYRFVCKGLYMGTQLLVITSSNGTERKSWKRIFLVLLLPLLLILGAWWWSNSSAVPLSGLKDTAITTTQWLPSTSQWLPSTSQWLLSWLLFWKNEDLSESTYSRIEIPSVPPLVEPNAWDIHKETLELALHQLRELQIFREKVERKFESDSSTQELNNKNYREDLTKMEQHLKSLDLTLTRIQGQLQDSDQEIELQKLKISLDNLKESLQYLKEKVEQHDNLPSYYNKFSEEKLVLQNEIENLKHSNDILQEQISHLLLETKRCCNPAGITQNGITEYLREVLVQWGEIGPSEKVDVIDKIKNMFVEKQELESRLANLTAESQLRDEEVVKKTAAIIMTALSDKIRSEVKQQTSQMKSPEVGNYKYSGISMDQVQEMIRDALATYDADKTGMVDFALESSGGSIVSTRCTESYQSRTASVTILGFPVPFFYESNSPRLVIQPEILPGKCWSFKGSQGYLVIKLSSKVNITEFSLEHAPKSLIPYGNIESAPKDFSVYGLMNESDKSPILLGDYKYLQNGTSLQHFKVQNKNSPAFEYVELWIRSNHGHMEYTCLYRFRVHGMPVRT